MAAVLAVALLLLCGNVNSAEDDTLTGYVTQVKTGETDTSSTAPVASPDLAPAISSPTGGSSSTHSAVLSALPQNEKSDVVLVDLARADDEQMNNMTLSAAPAQPPAAGDALPDGFDMVEADAPSADVGTPGPDSPQSDSVLPAEEESSENTPGTLVSDTDDTNYPNLPDSPDYSTGPGYGVTSTTSDDEATSDDAQAVSFSTSGSDSTDDSQGTLVSDTDDTNYPNLPDSPDYSTGPGYGVTSTTSDDEEKSDDDAQAVSFSTSGSDSTDDSQGTLVSDTDDTNYPNLPDSPDYSTGPGYGVTSTTSDDEATSDDAQAVSFSTSGSDSTDDSQGTLVSDTDDTNYPNLPDSPDYSTGPGYGVTSTTSDDEEKSDDDAQAVSFSTSGSDSTDDSQGTLVSDTDDTNYPNLPDSPDYSTGPGYGVGGEDAAITQDEAEPESDTSGVTLSQSRIYSPPLKPRATWGKGKCTFYGGMDAAGTMSGACGYGNLYASGYGAFTAALSSALFKNGLACGACYEVACTGNPKACKPGSVQVTVTNFCPPNPGQSATNGGWCNGANQHFDLSYPAFARIADPKAGAVDLNYRRVPCQKKGGVRYTLNGNCNFNLVTITNVGGSGVVTAVYMKADGMAWAPLSRNWGANWQCSRNYCGKGISIKIVTSDRKVSVSRLAGKDWAFGKTYVGKQVN